MCNMFAYGREDKLSDRASLEKIFDGEILAITLL